MKGVVHFGKRGKLSLRFIGLFEILSRVGSCTYQLALPPALSVVHNVFHVLMLQKYVPDVSHVLDFIELGVALNLTIMEWSIAILDREERVLRSWMISFVEVSWQHHGGDDVMCEHKDLMRNLYPHLFGKCDLFMYFSAYFTFLYTSHTRSLSLFTHLSWLFVLCLLQSRHHDEF